MFDYLDYVYVVEINQKKDAVRIFADEKMANITVELLRCLFPHSFINTYRITITNHCEVTRKNDNAVLIFV